MVGPRNTRTNPISDTACEVRVQADQSAGKLVIHTGGSPDKVEVPVKSWSPWVRLKFKFSMLQSVTGIVRFYVAQLKPRVEFYISPVNFDPAAPIFAISSPNNYARELSEKIGLFATLGMAEDHNGHNNGRFDEAAYLAQCNLIRDEREQMMLAELQRFTEGLFFVVFDTPDRFQHMFWRFRDPQHPCFDQTLARELEHSIEDHYRSYDGLLQKVLERVDENTLLIVLSDHGFNAFRRIFHTNTWLCENNLLALKNNKLPSDELDDSFANVDWSRTYAYALGLGGIYLNLKGRERDGILERGSEEAERVRRAIENGLGGIVDLETQRPAIRNVSRRENLYNGEFVKDSPDLLVNFHPGFRVSWQTGMGGFGSGWFEDNARRWSGDHIMDPDAVPGILLMNRAALHNAASILDLAPSILRFLNVAGHESMEGKPLL